MLQLSANIQVILPLPGTVNPALNVTLAAQTVTALLTQVAGTPLSPPSATQVPPTLLPTATRVAGELIALHSDRSGNRDLWVMNTDGSSPLQITFNSIIDSVPAWSPDGSWITFTGYDSTEVSMKIML